MTYLISDLVREGDLNKVTGKIASFVTSFGGKVAKEDIWGRRKLAYPIKKQDFATYVTIYFSLPADKMKEFDRDVRLTDGIVRHLTIVREFGEEALTLTAKEIADTEEIEKVIGGEKSFEAVEGETEESKELMAKREKEEKKEEKASVSKTTEEKVVTEDETVEELAEEIAEKAEELKETVLEKVEKSKTVSEKPKKSAAKKEKAVKEDKKVSDEVERLSKLNEELDDILKDEL